MASFATGGIVSLVEVVPCAPGIQAAVTHKLRHPTGQVTRNPSMTPDSIGTTPTANWQFDPPVLINNPVACEASKRYQFAG